MLGKIYVGITPESYEVFRSKTEPTRETHGNLYNACIGPFRTIRGAKAMCHYGNSSNPHCVNVQQAERLGLKNKDQLVNLPKKWNRQTPRMAGLVAH